VDDREITDLGRTDARVAPATVYPESVQLGRGSQLIAIFGKRAFENRGMIRPSEALLVMVSLQPPGHSIF